MRNLSLFQRLVCYTVLMLCVGRYLYPSSTFAGNLYQNHQYNDTVGKYLVTLEQLIFGDSTVVGENINSKMYEPGKIHFDQKSSGGTSSSAPIKSSLNVDLTVSCSDKKDFDKISTLTKLVIKDSKGMVFNQGNEFFSKALASFHPGKGSLFYPPKPPKNVVDFKVSFSLPYKYRITHIVSLSGNIVVYNNVEESSVFIPDIDKAVALKKQTKDFALDFTVQQGAAPGGKEWSYTIRIASQFLEGVNFPKEDKLETVVFLTDALGKQYKCRSSRDKTQNPLRIYEYTFVVPPEAKNLGLTFTMRHKSDPKELPFEIENIPVIEK